ncbi:hypothetical protein M8R20_02425 [Pseudomonas sp. R2.Fl]|nr:hypothetical protein [Pseudomonas sp. R2.Fl]
MNKHTRPDRGASSLRTRDESPESSDAISLRLRHFYDSVQEEALPPNLINLLELLDEAERRQVADNRRVEG